DDTTGIVDINPKESKIARANAITPFMEAGNVWFPHPDEQPWVIDPWLFIRMREPNIPCFHKRRDCIRSGYL
ncbi:hypothetical protein PT100_08860, partial [Erysipelothrix rhusiopathiae]|nr:hypothetical protein [Erysipelothrix rhusiopathiae]